MSYELHNIGQQTALAVSNAAVALTLPAGTRHALIYVAANAMRWLAQGAATPPTASVGMFVDAGFYINFMDPDYNYGDLLTAFRIIRSSADGTIDALYFD